MNADFGKQIEEAHKRLEKIQKYASTFNVPKELLKEAISEISMALEELHITTEELLAARQAAEVATEKLLDTRQLAEWERQRYWELFEFAPDGYIVTDSWGKIQEANLAASTLLNTPKKFLTGKPLAVFVAEAERQSFRTKLEQLVQGQPLREWEVSLKPRQRKPLPGALSVSAIRSPHGALELRWLIRDLSSYKLMEQLRHDVLHDGLTGLPNRTLLFNNIKRAIWRSKRHPEQTFALLFLDVDRFKSINDHFGHLAGDQVLIEIASRLRHCLREIDTIARLGGDEFVVLLEDINRQDAQICADRIQKVQAEPLRLGDRAIAVTLSIGIVLNTPEHQQPEELLRDADRAMYLAKQQGGSSQVSGLDSQKIG